MANVISSVIITEEVFHVCSSHALSTEKEEIMGMLLGDVLPEKEAVQLVGQHSGVQVISSYSNLSGTTASKTANKISGKTEKGTPFSQPCVAVVWAVSVLVRSDRRKDRVEVSPEQQVFATEQAEKLQTLTGRRTRVIGWYHSHPHITVFPSHVDVKTQMVYQQMDPLFIGLIFSCFLKNTSSKAYLDDSELSAANTSRQQVCGKMDLIAFQAIDSSSSDRRVTEQARSLALHTGERFQRLEIPVCTVPLFSTHKLWSNAGAFAAVLHACLQNLVQIRTIFVEEERKTYYSETFRTVPAPLCASNAPSLSPPLSSSSLSSRSSPSSSSLPPSSLPRQQGKRKRGQEQVHPLKALHHASLYHATACQQLETLFFPLIQSLSTQIGSWQTAADQLSWENTQLQLQLQKDPLHQTDRTH